MELKLRGFFGWFKGQKIVGSHQDPIVKVCQNIQVITDAICYMHTINDLYIRNGWFELVKSCKNLVLRRKERTLCVNQTNKVLPKDLIELKMGVWPGGIS